jgi:hypothetical protein
LDYGELALNYADGKLYYKDNTNTIQAFDSNVQSAIWTRITSSTTASTGDKLVADTSGGSFTVTLPTTPSQGASVILADGGNWATNNLIVNPSSNTIEGLSGNIELDISNIQVEIVYSGTTWQVYAFTAPGTSLNNDVATNVTQYLGMSRNTTGAWDAAYIATTKLYFNPSTGTLNSTDYNSLSDLRLKENVLSITNAISILDKVRPVEFSWKEDGRKAFGVIAQELEEVLPQMVATNSDNDIKSVSYTQLIPVLVQAIKELKERNS